MALIAATPKGYEERGTFEIVGGSQPSWPHPVVAEGGAAATCAIRTSCWCIA